MKKLVFTLLFGFFTCLSFAQLNMSLLAQVDYNQDVNDIWGYRSSGADSTEYALVGTRTGVSIISLSDPANPEEVQFITGPNSLWRDIKTWEDHAYVTNETGGGLLVIDMSQMQEDTFAWYRWMPEIPEWGAFTDAHNLFVDEFGYGYICGTNLLGSRTIIVDLFSDPHNPEYVAVGPPVYAHDIFARDNVMYASEIQEGRMAIYDVVDKGNITLLATQQTPGDVTHNIWLSDDSKIAFTTDEVNGAPVTAYDISDLDNIVELDQYRPIVTLGFGVKPHNVHVWNDWLILSYYEDGGIIVDASRPHNLIEVGNFDTFLGSAGGLHGAWGAYPFLPSGIVLVTDIANGLFILDATYVRACFLEGKVTNAASGLPITNVTVEIDSEQANFAVTGLEGEYETGQAIPGTFQVTFSAAGYLTQIVDAELINGEVTILDIELVPLDQAIGFSVSEPEGCAPFSVTYTDESLAEAVEWLWEFPGGEPETSTLENPTVIYNEPGTYSATLAITEVLGNEFNIAQDSIVEVGITPEASFSAMILGDTVFFTNNSIDALGYNWDFGDGTTSMMEDPFHVYTETGIYQVVLSAFNDCTTTNYIQNVSIIITGTEAQLNRDHLMVSPNPFSQQFTLDFEEEPTSNYLVRVIDAQGQLLETFRLSTSSNVIDGEAWPNGIYFVQFLEVDENKVTRTVKVVKY